MINPTQALYAFINWIGDSPVKEMIGAGHHAANLRGELAHFCKANDLPMLEDDWMDGVNLPPRSSDRVTKDHKYEKES